MKYNNEACCWEYTEEELNKELEILNSLSRYEMCRLHRFTPSFPPHKYFDMTSPLWEPFKERFLQLGGFSPEISKSLGWD